jgi:hypothetical protein
MKAFRIFDKGKDSPLSLYWYFISSYFVENSEQGEESGSKSQLDGTLQTTFRTFSEHSREGLINLSFNYIIYCS